jgi:hypothetical protein
MFIDPTKSGGADPMSSPRVDQDGGQLSTRLSGELNPAATQPARDASSGDGELSLLAEARAPGGAKEGSSAAGIPADRLRGILERISSNYYDAPHVRDRIAQKLQSEFGMPPTQ